MNDNKEFISALRYDCLTGFYDLIVKLTMPEEKFRTRLIDELSPENGEAILEFGFGTGQNLILASQRNFDSKLRGLDIDPKVKAIAENKMNRLGLDLGLDLYEGDTFPYANHSFDKVFSSLVFHQLDKNTKLSCLREIYRVLKPNGQLVIGDWGRAKSTLMRLTFYCVQILDGFKTTNDSVQGLLPGFMELSGFREVTETGFINTKIGSYCYYTALK